MKMIFTINLTIFPFFVKYNPVLKYGQHFSKKGIILHDAEI